MKSLAMVTLLSLTLAMTAPAGAQDEAAAEPPKKSKRELRREARAAEAAAEAQAAAEKSAETGLVCRREIVTGSHRRIERCYTHEQLRAMRQGSQEAMRDRRSPAAAPRGDTQ